MNSEFIAKPHPLSRGVANALFAPIAHTHDDRYYTEAEIVTLLSGYALTSHTHNASAIDAGTLSDARLSANVVTLTGTQTLTNKSIVATQLTGTIADARLSSNVVTLTGSQTLTNKTLTSPIVGGDVFLNTDNIGMVAAGGTTYGIVFRDTTSRILRVLNSTGTWADSITSGFFQLSQGNGFFTGNNGAILSRFGVSSTATMISNLAYNALLVPQTLLHLVQSTADSLSSVVDALTIERTDTSGLAAGGGVGLPFKLKSSTTQGRYSGYIRSSWYDPTNAAAIADLVGIAAHNANGTVTEREGWRIRGGASATEMAFFGATPVAKPALGAWAGLTADQKMDALRDALSNLGLASYS